MGNQADFIRERFTALVLGPEENLDLAEAALLIAADYYPHLDSTFYLKRLDDFADACKDRAGNSLDAISAINTTLFGDLGFTGNTDDYYDPRNSFLNDVIDRKAGIPITLSLVYIEVARRIGLAVHGVGMPSHFLVGYKEPGHEIFIDPFNRGTMMDAEGCGRLLARISGNRINLLPEHLQPVTKKQMLTRILSNLFAIYTAFADNRRALSLVDWILIINPNSASHLRDRGLTLAALGNTSGARRDLALYLSLAPSSADSPAIRQRLGALRRLEAAMN